MGVRQCDRYAVNNCNKFVFLIFYNINITKSERVKMKDELETILDPQPPRIYSLIYLWVDLTRRIVDSCDAKGERSELQDGARGGTSCTRDRIQN